MLRLTAMTALCCLLGAGAALAQSPYGLWARGDGDARVNIAPCGENLCATNVWIRNPGTEQPGHRLIMRLRQTGEAVWTGSAFDPQRNMNFSMRMEVERQRMTTRGCAFGGLVCRSTTWTRLR